MQRRNHFLFLKTFPYVIVLNLTYVCMKIYLFLFIEVCTLYTLQAHFRSSKKKLSFAYSGNMTQVPGVTWDNGMKEDKLNPAVVHACRRWPVGNMKNYILTVHLKKPLIPI